MYLYRMTGTVAAQQGLPAVDLRHHANGWTICGKANGSKTVTAFMAQKDPGGAAPLQYVVGDLRDWLAASDYETLAEFAVLFLPGVRVAQERT